RRKTRGTERETSKRDPEKGAHDLRRHVQRRVPERQPTEAQESERHGRIQMRPGPLPGRRIDEEDRGEPHGEAHQRPPLERRGYRGADGRGGMLEQHGEEARREEERAEAEGLAGDLDGMAAQRTDQSHRVSSSSGPSLRRIRIARAEGSARSTVTRRKSSATLHACAGHPPGRNGSSASNTSEI